MIKLRHTYDFGSAYSTSLAVNWNIEDIIGGDKTLDFRKPFLPDVWVEAGALGFLSQSEKLTLNHIRSHAYLYIFGFVEEFIVPFVVDEARARIHHTEQEEIRAVLHFAEEESKHIDLFKRFREEFHRGFTHECDVIGQPETVATQILRKSPLGVVLAILHIEWATQRHYVESVRGNHDLDPQFCSLLKHHWMEEAQHTKLDMLMMEAMVQNLNIEDIQKGIGDYIDIGGMLDAGFAQQVELDLQSLSKAIGRRLSDGEEQAYQTEQLQSYRKTFLIAGLTHPKFQDMLVDLSAEGAVKVNEWACSLVQDCVM